MQDLGLPLEYSQLAKYFNVHNINEETAIRNETVSRILKQHEVSTVLDLTCGTGSQLFHLLKQGFYVVGADISPELLKLAQQAAEEQNINLSLTKGDMRTLQLGKFDAVITIFNAIGHLTKEEFAKALVNVRKNLKAGGIYIFDIFNAAVMTDEKVEALTMDIKERVQGVDIHNTQYSTFNYDNGQLTSYDHYTIKRPNQEEEEIDHRFTLQLYHAQELESLLHKAGFQTLHQLELDGSAFSSNESSHIVTTAKVIKC